MTKYHLCDTMKEHNTITKLKNHLIFFIVRFLTISFLMKLFYDIAYTAIEQEDINLRKLFNHSENKKKL